MMQKVHTSPAGVGPAAHTYLPLSKKDVPQERGPLQTALENMA